jgi:DNA-binding transcriptional LysR family regulator
MNLTLKQLRAFTAVADAGSFTDAAKKMYLTQSGLSLLVKELETELGVRVFDRNTRKIKLSTAGADFYPLAVKVLEDLDAAVKSTLQLQDKKRGTVRIACTPLYSSSLLPRALMEYRGRFPAIEVRLLDSLNEQALARVASGEADFAVAPQRDSRGDIDEEPLFLDRFEIVSPASHPLTRHKRLHWRQVLEYPFVSLTSDYSRRLQNDLLVHSHKLKLTPAHEVSYLTTALGMVRAGLGVTAMPSSALPMISPLGLKTLAVDQPVVHRQVSFFSKRGQTLSPAAESFHSFLVEFTGPLRSARGRRLPGTRGRETPANPA